MAFDAGQTLYVCKQLLAPDRIAGFGDGFLAKLFGIELTRRGTLEEGVIARLIDTHGKLPRTAVVSALDDEAVFARLQADLNRTGIGLISARIVEAVDLYAV